MLNYFSSGENEAWKITSAEVVFIVAKVTLIFTNALAENTIVSAEYKSILIMFTYFRFCCFVVDFCLWFWFSFFFVNRREEMKKFLTEPGETVQSIVAFPRYDM